MRGINPALFATSDDSLWYESTSGTIRGGGSFPTVNASQPPAGGWGDGKSFGDRTVMTSTIVIDGQSNVVIDDLFFDGLTYSVFQYSTSTAGNAHVCVRVLNSSNITIRNCDFKDVSECVEVYNSSNVLVEYNRCDGITGPAERVNEQTGNFLQTHGGSSFVEVLNNKIIAISDYDPWGGAHQLGTEDVISLFGADDSTAQYNQIDATGYTRDYGTGTILGDGFGDRCQIRDNTYLNPGQVGIAVAGGYDHVMDGNIIYRDANQILGAGNTAAYYWDYNGNGIGGGVVSNNRAKFINGGGFWNPGGATEINNNWDDNTIDPNDLEVVL